ncbi:hypothetical protein BV22DRAFT_844235 [Leucogyrophana mollusca]|uniref:Uncharacterized protein n=1 Tax=Leucogyrophana mollusca TaxID=85980 RepID=A0ACB8B2P5_9AGAM|nr:hypothetical protein BV22DRAFT_844235 [Leucogyrophana mollusca]
MRASLRRSRFLSRCFVWTVAALLPPGHSVWTLVQILMITLLSPKALAPCKTRRPVGLHRPVAYVRSIALNYC